MLQTKDDPNFADHPIHGIKGQVEFYTVVMRYVRQKRTAIDAGAHIGLWTRMLSTSFHEVYAFEPVPENFQCLKANTADCNNVACFNVALGAHKGTVEMTITEGENSGTWHVQPSVSAKTPLVTLDAHCEKLCSDVDFIKIDVEGFEGFVASGATEILKRDKPVVCFEDNGLGARYYEQDWLDPKEVLEKLGYRRLSRIRRDEVWACTR
jgi:FkbM family methyltransferase